MFKLRKSRRKPEEAPVITSIDPLNLPEGEIAVVDPTTLPSGQRSDFGPTPDVPDGPLNDAVLADVELLYGEPISGNLSIEQFVALEDIGDSGDPRLAWLIADHLRVSLTLAKNESLPRRRFFDLHERLSQAAFALVGLPSIALEIWNPLTNALMAWDIPEPPDYLRFKRNIYTPVEPAWEPLMSDSSDIDWRMVSWGGVRIDSRPFDRTDEPCRCIPAADNPTFRPASETTWLDPEDVVFGVVINGEARAYPRQIMEAREMVNDTLGGRDFAMPYCTLCGAAQVWFTDDLPDGIDRPVLRTSGLLARSNKVMYDLTSQSIFDTFLGTAVSGPLFERGIALVGHTVVTSTWATWKAQHPETTVLTKNLALGTNFDFRNGRDANGPIFPIGDADPRLALQEDVLGIIQSNGQPLAVHVNSAKAALRRGKIVVVNGIRVVSSGDGLLAFDSDGNEVVAHQAFWFAWSQFYPETELWPAT